MMFALLACNAYQLLILHKLNAESAKERRKLANRTSETKTANKINKAVNKSDKRTAI